MEAKAIRLVGPQQRAYALQLLAEAPTGWSVTFEEKKRTPPQNRKMWAMIGDVRAHKPDGLEYQKETWKALFMAALGFEVEYADALDGYGSGPVPIGMSSSRLSSRQMSDLIEVIYEYGNRKGVVWKETMKGGWLC